MARLSIESELVSEKTLSKLLEISEHTLRFWRRNNSRRYSGSRSTPSNLTLATTFNLRVDPGHRPREYAKGRLWPKCRKTSEFLRFRGVRGNSEAFDAAGFDRDFGARFRSEVCFPGGGESLFIHH